MPSGYSSPDQSSIREPFVVVTGCYAQLKPGAGFKYRGVDVVLGAEQKGELINYLGSLEKHEHGEAITTATKDIVRLLHLAHVATVHDTS